MKLNGKFLAVKYERYFPAFSRRNAKDSRDLREKRKPSVYSPKYNDDIRISYKKNNWSKTNPTPLKNFNFPENRKFVCGFPPFHLMEREETWIERNNLEPDHLS